MLTTTLMLTGVASAGDYDNVNLPSIIPTAYQDAQISVNKDKKQATDAKEGQANGGDAKNADQAKEDATTAENNLAKNVQVLMKEGNFGTTGFFFGPTSGNSKVDAYGSLTSSVGLDRAGIDQFGANSGQPKRVQAYHAFGLAVTHLVNSAKKENAESIGFESSVGEIEKMATSVARLGLKLVKEFNPMPVIGAFYDSTFLNNAAYSGHADASEDNKLIALINRNPSMREVIRFFGDPVSIGGASVSFAYFITACMVFLAIGYAAFLKLWNGQNSGIVMRKSLVKIVFAAIAVPLICDQGSKLLDTVTELSAFKTYPREQQILRNNLNIYAWYKNAAFGLPPGESIQVKNGYFVFTPDLIYKINQHASTNKTSAPVVDKKETVNNNDDGDENLILDLFHKFQGKPKKDQGSSNQTNTPVQNLDDQTIVYALLSSATSNNNETKVTFSPSYSSGNADSVGNIAGVPWDTSDIMAYAESLGGNKKYDPKEKKITDSPYVKSAKLQENDGSGINFTYTQKEAGYGISPISAFNMMATDFNTDGFVVKTNTEEIKTPTVAINIVSASVSGGSVPGIVKLFMLFTIIMAGVKSIMNILTSGFGGIFKGSAGSSLGSSAGVGTLIGSVLAITVGIVGLSVILTIALGVIDMLWAFISDMLGGSEMKGVLDEFSSGLLGRFKSIPIVGSLFASALESIVSLVMTIVALMMMPQIVKTPVVAYGEWVAGIPSAISERFANWERVFTGDYRSSGSSIFGGGSSSLGGGGGSGGGALAAMKNEEKAKRNERMGALKTGGAMMAGASIAKIGSMMAHGGDKNHSEGNDTENENTSENMSDTETLAEENAMESANSEERAQSEHTSSGTDTAEKDATLDKVGGKDSSVSEKLNNEKESSDRSREDTHESKNDNGGSEDHSSESNAPGSEDSVAGDSVTPEANHNAVNPDGSINTNHSPDGTLNTHNPDGSTGEHSDTPHSDLNNGGTGDHHSMNDIKESINENVAGDNEINDHDANINSSQINSISNEKKGDSANSKDSKSKASNTGSKAGTMSTNGIKPSGKTNSLASGNGKVNKGGKTSSNSTSKSNNQGKRGSGSTRTPGKLRTAVGKSLMSMGGVDPNQKLAKGDTRKMFSAGMLHASGGVVGLHRHTGKVAQSQIDKRNERILRNGGEIRSNLSAIGESRQDAQQRLEARIRTSNARNGQDNVVHDSRSENVTKSYTERPIQRDDAKNISKSIDD